MTQYTLTYHGSPGEMPSDPKEMEEAMAAWGAWYGSIGEDNLVDGGAPFGAHAAIDSSGAVISDLPAQLTGYTIVTADSIDAAVEIAKGCPVLATGGSVQVSECLDLG